MIKLTTKSVIDMKKMEFCWEIKKIYLKEEI